MTILEQARKELEKAETDRTDLVARLPHIGDNAEALMAMTSVTQTSRQTRYLHVIALALIDIAETLRDLRLMKEQEN